MRRPLRTSSALGEVFVLVIFAVFAVFVMATLFLGVNAYSSVVRGGDEASDTRTLAHLVETKVRQSEGKGQVSVEDYDGTKVLSLYEDIDGKSYVTQLYSWDGWLCELFTYSDLPFDPSQGERLVKAEVTSMEDDDGLVRIGLTDANGRPVSLALFVRGDA